MARYAACVRWSSSILAVMIGAAVAAGCSRASDESEAKRSPVAPPPPSVEVPRDLKIAVDVDGAAAEPITAASLTAIEPDFHDADRRAWKLTRLLPALDRDGAVVEARGEGGISIRVARPGTAEEPQPVLFLTRRGEVMVSVVDPSDPFPNYHGQGGRLKRQGDPLPRLSGVVGLAIFTKP